MFLISKRQSEPPHPPFWIVEHMDARDLVAVLFAVTTLQNNVHRDPNHATDYDDAIAEGYMFAEYWIGARERARHDPTADTR